MDDPLTLPLGVAAVARNVKFHLTSVRTRDGIRSDWGFVTGAQKQVTGLASLKVSDTQVPLVYDQGGSLKVEQPVGSGVLVPITSTQLTLPQNASLQAAAAYKKAYLAFTDLLNSSGTPAVLNLLTLALDPLSMKPSGVPWAASTTYQVGDTVTPSSPVGGNGHVYRCSAITTGISSAAQPAFPTTEGGAVVDGGVTWTETTPVMAQTLQQLLTAAPTVTRAAGAGTFAASRDVYIAITLVNGNGETVMSSIFSFVNTTLNDRFIVTSPVLPTWVQQLTGANAVTGYRVYQADVATGSAAPVASAFHLYIGTNLIGVNLNVDTSAGAAAPPAADTARIVPVGNICSGLRYAVVMGVSRSGYITGITQAAVVTYNPAASPGNGLQLYMAHVPIFPSPQTAARIVAFTPAGQLSSAAGTGITSAGPYFWIPPNFPNGIFDLSTIAAGVTVADAVNGISMTSTLINDNTSTSATFNFTDDYLKLTENDVSPYFRKIQVPNCSDVYYSANLKRMFYAVDSIKSGWYVSLEDDAESIYGDSILQVAQDDGQARIAVRDYKTNTYAMKEESGWLVSPSTSNPGDWKPILQWRGSGPCGPRAVDVCSTFMCYVHRSGVWIFIADTPFCISLEIPITWKNINWAAQKTIWVTIDEDMREVHIGVPYGSGVTEPNIELVCNYEESPQFERPIHFSPIAGREIATGSCYKWSINDIAANVCVRSRRALVNPPADMDLATRQSQLLYGSSSPDGVVSAVVPGVFNDNGGAINSIYETVCPEKFLKPAQLGGVQANVDGQGVCRMEVLAMRAKDPSEAINADPRAVIPLKKPVIAGQMYACGARGNYEKYRLRLTNGNQKDVWFDWKWAAIYARPSSVARRG